jgi:EAL domain-containing protein (putative c-di-GMP-specific phosphodiesterase class I)
VRHFWPIVAAACLGLAVAVSAWFAVSVWEERLAKAKFTGLAGDYAAVLQNGLDEYLDKIVAVRAFYDFSHGVDLNEFELFTARILEGHDGLMRPSDLELELTESVLMEATQRHSNTLENLRQLGTRISIDDFGTGYSSLKYLTQYPVTRLKLAQEFVFRVTTDYRNAAVVRAAIRLANELGLEVIAEGVETKAQVRFLMGAGCEQAQGYYFSRPVTALKATELLRAERIEPRADPVRPIASSAA